MTLPSATEDNHNEDEPTSNKLNSFLKSAGIEASRVDPSSLEALRDIVNGKNPSNWVHDDVVTVDAATTATTSHSNMALVDHSTSSGEHDKQDEESTRIGETNTMTTPGAIPASPSRGLQQQPQEQFSLQKVDENRSLVEEVGSSNIYPTVQSFEAPALEIPDDATPTERLILQKLHEQALLLQQLRHQLMEHQHSVARTPPSSPPAAAAPVATPVQPRPAPQPSPFWLELQRRFEHIEQGFAHIPPPRRAISIWTMVKVLIMTSILMQRTSSSTAGSDMNQLFILMAVTLAISIYLSLDLLIFTWKLLRVLFQGERFDWAHGAVRVEDGNNVRNPAVGEGAINNNNNNEHANHQPNNPQPAAPPQDGRRWDDWIFADQQRHPFMRGIFDVLVFVGSFIASIFPIWEPPQPRPAREEEEPPANAGEDNDDGEQEQQQEPPPDG